VTGLAVTVFVLVAVGGPDAWTIVTIAGFLLAVVVLVVAVERPARLRTPAVAVLRVVRRVRRRPTDDVGAVVDGVVDRLATVRLRRTDWIVLAVFAVASIATDCAALFCCVHAVTRLPPVCTSPSLSARQAQRCARLQPPATGTVLLAYAVGQGATTIPVVPGGIGLVETAMTATFTAGHLALIPALSVVLLYRLLSYWAVILIGGGCWFVLRRHRLASGSG
jgi:putative heme transporter